MILLCMWRCGTYSDALSNLSAPEEYSDSRIGTGRHATPTKVTTSVEAVGSSSRRRRHLGESVFFDSTKDDASNAVGEGIILLYNSWALILFDPGATHTFIRTAYAFNWGLSFEKLEHTLNVDLPTGEQLGTRRVYKGCVLRIREHELIMDLVVIDLKGYEVIFRMKLLSAFWEVMIVSASELHFSYQEG